jgi:hypothetical protein
MGEGISENIFEGGVIKVFQNHVPVQGKTIVLI